MSNDEQLAWHKQRLDALQAPDGWLTLVGLDFLTEGSHTIGSSPKADLAYLHCDEPFVGTLVVHAESVEFTPTGGTPQQLTADDRGAPSVIRSGSVSMTLVRRNGMLALRVRDSESQVRLGFTGISLFSFDPSLVVQARVVPPSEGEQIAITNIRGVAARAGDARVHAGRDHASTDRDARTRRSTLRGVCRRHHGNGVLRRGSVSRPARASQRCCKY